MAISKPKETAYPGDLRLEVRDLSKSYGKHIHALKKISFSVGPGVFGLLGPNGAGKSTLINILATILAPETDSVYFQNQSLQKNPDFVRQHLGFLPQSFGVYPRTSAWHLLEYIAVLKGLTDKKSRRRQMTELFALTHLLDHKDRAVAQFSGGMKQRFGLAQALLGSPRLLIVDEPTAGLDPYERNHFHQIITELGQRMIVVLSTHLVSDVANLCPNIMILNEGEVRFLGTPQHLIAGMKDRVWCADCDSGQLNSWKRRFPVLSVRFSAGRQKVHILATDPPPGFQPAVPDLEDAYFAVLNRGGASC